MSWLNSWDGIFALSTIILAIYLYTQSRRQRSPYPLPPGPKKLPLLGNVFQIPAEYAWKTYAEWAKKYDSSIIHLNAMGQSILILNSYDDAKELLEKRSAIYSSRPTSVMLSELSGFGFQFGLMPYGEPWRVRRRLFKKYFNPSNAIIHHIQEEKYIYRLLFQLLEKPDSFSESIQHMTGSISISMTYGVDVLQRNDPNINVAQHAGKVVGDLLSSGPRIVDMIPFLKHLPIWFPGATFQKAARKSRQHAGRLKDDIFTEAQKKWTHREAPNPSFVSLCLENVQGTMTGEELDICKDVAGNVYMAATDSTSAAIRTFFLAMICFPDVQRCAQQELDGVLDDRLPTHSDLSSLPYISAIVKEVLRWKAIVPAGVAHLSTAPDIYKGYFIPENTIVIPNAWAMLRNEADYPDYDRFKPERYLNDEGRLGTDDGMRDPADITFGFGRRICPGAHIAQSVVWLTIASILTVFNIEKAVDINGIPLEPDCEFTSSAISQPPPFKCTLKPRSPDAVLMIQEVMELAALSEE